MLKKFFAGAVLSLSLLAAGAAIAVTLEVYVPAGNAEIPANQLAPRVNTLDGKRVAFLWNLKPGGEWLLDSVKDQLRTRFKDMTYIDWPTQTASWLEDITRYQKAQPADVVILSLGD